ncbi:MAG TPA: YggT family protein [Nitrospirota bacterium]|nr:YggT family protein [Nitrospirota bacterium]
MFVLSNLLTAIAAVLDIILTAYMWLVIARAIISWVNPDPYNFIVRFLYAATEPVLRPIRRRLPAMGIDLSPLLVIAAIYFVRIFLVGTLRDMALRMHLGG